MSRQRRLECLVAVLLLGAAALCFRRGVSRAAAALTGTGDHYSDEISKTYDFKFGPNPFAPSNATSTTGTFIPGALFTPRSRGAPGHRGGRGGGRQSAPGNFLREPFYQ